ncbi:serine hydrolase [Sphingomonas sp. QA11]|uniref:serine hydrolase n=1 Tax=Sphingomonas sp. QA11 TaxID=2950605 RepID=UPI00234B9826|nr:serine hydrolase [Sphingomonas sp. QA11]WCM28575.1 serine hydrolase [Sphingomonas sp. QA11]
MGADPPLIRSHKMETSDMRSNPMFTSTRRQALLGFGALGAEAVLASGSAKAAQPVSGMPDLDGMVGLAMRAFGTPGLSIALISPGSEPILRGYGVRGLGKAAPVDPGTVFAIASNSKAFTAAALALLVDEGRLDWDDPVGNHLPGFRLYDAYASQQMTVADLLTHRSGLGLGQGDLLFWPGGKRTAAEVVRQLRYLKPATSFRANFAYDNVLYIAAGELIRSVSGLSWETFVQQRLLSPMEMQDSAPDQSLLTTSNRAATHARIDGPVRGTGRMQIISPLNVPGSAVPDPSNAAGGIYASARDMARWLQVQLARGKTPDGKRLWSEEGASQMWRPRTLVSASATPPARDGDPHFLLYALGWGLQDHGGTPFLAHSGGIEGAASRVVLVPELGVGFAILTNAEEQGCHMSIAGMLLDHYTARTPTDWIAAWKAKGASSQAAALKAIEAAQNIRATGGAASLPLAAYAGIYRDDWYGKIVIAPAGAGLAIDFTRNAGMRGRLEHWSRDTFRTRFDNPVIENAYVTFALNEDGSVDCVKMRAISPMADFSYDYQDILLTRVNDAQR